MGNYFTVFFFFVQPEIFLLQREKERKRKIPSKCGICFWFYVCFLFSTFFFVCAHMKHLYCICADSCQSSFFESLFSSSPEIIYINRRAFFTVKRSAICCGVLYRWLAVTGSNSFFLFFGEDFSRE